MSDFVPHHLLVHAPGCTPQRYLLVLHGVFGSGKNWRLFMRKLVAACPQWGAVLVDVRGHGQSDGAAGPHHIDAVAYDLLRLEKTLSAPVAGVCGHSLGGKLALGYAGRRRSQLRQVWVLDARPDRMTPEEGLPSQVVLRLLRSLPATFDTRGAFVEAIQQGGLTTAVAQWLAMNLQRDGVRFRLGLELDVIGELLDSYYASDMWPELRAAVPKRALHLVVGTRSYVWDKASIGRLDKLADEQPSFRLHRLDASHWLHVDKPDALLALMVAALSP